LRESTESRCSRGRTPRLLQSDARIATGDLVEEAVDDHDVRKHYADGADFLDDFRSSKRRLPSESMPVLQAIDKPLLLRERCRLRRLRVRS
jgi:hypothetical protein